MNVRAEAGFRISRKCQMRVRNVRWRFYVHDGEVGQPVGGEDDVLSVTLVLFDIIGSVIPEVAAWKNSTTYRNI